MNDNVLYVKNEKMTVSDVGDQENIWDDSLLIKAYERAINSAKEKIAEKINLENGDDTTGDEHLQMTNGQSTNIAKGKKHKKSSLAETKGVWTVGMHCRATYSEDGVEYEAIISSVNTTKGTCRVKYVGYNNEEIVSVASLKQSHGPEARKLQIQQCEINKEVKSYENNNINNANMDSWQFKEQGMIPPPPPPHVMAHFPKDESDALSAMLMAWYMSGYHTGYYQGLTKGRNKFAN